MLACRNIRLFKKKIFCHVTQSTGLVHIYLYVIYFKLVRYVRKMNRRVSPANILTRAERELKMVRNIITLMNTSII
jgi:hypothetical protein